MSRSWGRDNRPGRPHVWKPGVKPLAPDAERWHNEGVGSSRSRLYARGSQPKRYGQYDPTFVYGGTHISRRGETKGYTYSTTPAEHRPIREWVGDYEHDWPVEPVEPVDGIVWVTLPRHYEHAPELALDFAVTHWREFSWGKQVPGLMLTMQLNQEFDRDPYGKRPWGRTNSVRGQRMVTNRYFAAMQPDHWVVWDRYSRKNQIVAEFPRSAKGEQQARDEADKLNDEAQARSGIRGET